jgi:hypothetical protein
MSTPTPTLLTLHASTPTRSVFKQRWFKKDTKNNALAHSITAAKALASAIDLTGFPWLKSVVGGFVVILENVQVRFMGQSALYDHAELNLVIMMVRVSE